MRHLTRPLALLAATILVLGACGSDDEETTTGAIAGDERAELTEPEAGDADGHSESDEPEPEAGASEPSTTAAPEAVGSSEATVVEVEMNEFGYEPSELTVPAGVPVRFVFTNVGAIEHEAMIGSAHQQEEFASDGHGDGHGGGHHGEVHAITLAPGETGELEATFDEPGELLLGCHLPGHWDAGMKAALTVT